MHRFWFLAAFAEAGSAIISGNEYHHLRRVLKLQPGDVVEVFDGAGQHGIGKIARHNSDHSVVALEGLPTVSLQLCPRLEVAVGALRHGDFDELIAPLSELGVAVVHCFHQEGAERSRITPKAEERWQRLALAAAKQCKRTWLLEVKAHAGAAHLVQHWQEQGAGQRIYLAPDGPRSLNELEVATQPQLVVVGGEKGLSAAEVGLLEQAGFIAARISPFVLRAKTAVVAAAAVMSHHVSMSAQ